MNLNSANAQSAINPVGSYTYRFSDREGRPSKCDCDYYEEQIDLNADGTFLFMDQRGRLDARQQWEKGTWAIVNDSTVELVTTHAKGFIYALRGEDANPNEWREAGGRKNFIYERGRLFTQWRDKKYER